MEVLGDAGLNCLNTFLYLWISWRKSVDCVLLHQRVKMGVNCHNNYGILKISFFQDNWGEICSVGITALFLWEKHSSGGENTL